MAAMLARKAWQSMLDTSGFVMASDILCCFLGKVTGLTSPMPPSCTGRARSARMSSFGAGWPVRAGMSFCDTASSRGFRRLSSIGVVTLSA